MGVVAKNSFFERLSRRGMVDRARELLFYLGSSRILYPRARRAFLLSTISDDIRARRTQRIESLVGVLHNAIAGLVRKLDGVVGNTSSWRIEIL